MKKGYFVRVMGMDHRLRQIEDFVEKKVAEDFVRKQEEKGYTVTVWKAEQVYGSPNTLDEIAGPGLHHPARWLKDM